MRESYRLIGYKVNEMFFYSREFNSITRLDKFNYKVNLRKTKGMLLDYLFSRSESLIITDKELMHDVWLKSGLRFSPQRMMLVVRELNDVFNGLNISENIFNRVHSTGYRVNNVLIMKVYEQKSNLNDNDSFFTR